MEFSKGRITSFLGGFWKFDGLGLVAKTSSFCLEAFSSFGVFIKDELHPLSLSKTNLALRKEKKVSLENCMMVMLTRLLG